MLCRCDYLEPCHPTRGGCNCCSCKNVAKGKFGLAYVVETPRRKYAQPFGWELEFEDTPSNISNNCKKMTKWINRPPIGECLEKEMSYCCRSVEVTKCLNASKEKCICYCAQCVIKEPPCACNQGECCKPKMCYCCFTNLQELQNCSCNVKCIPPKDDQCCSCKTPCSPPKSCHKIKRCKCNRDKKYLNCSPNGDTQCSKTRSKSRKSCKKRIKQYSCQTDCDDYLDYIPGKEASTRKETTKNLTEKSNRCDSSCNQKALGPNSDSDKSYKEKSFKSTKNQGNDTWGDNTMKSFHENDVLSSTRAESKEPGTNKSIKKEPDTTLNQKKYDHHNDTTPLLQKIRRAHHKQVEDIEEARETELALHTTTF